MSNNQQQYKDTRAAIAAVVAARFACLGFGAYYIWHRDAYGVGLMVALFWGVGFLLPVTKK